MQYQVRMDMIENAYGVLTDDPRITVWHISLFIALLHLWRKNNFHNPVPITRKLVMTLAHIYSIATYHKCIKQLQEFGYIDYRPSYHPHLGTKIWLLTMSVE